MSTFCKKLKRGRGRERKIAFVKTLKTDPKGQGGVPEPPLSRHASRKRAKKGRLERSPACAMEASSSTRKCDQRAGKGPERSKWGGFYTWPYRQDRVAPCFFFAHGGVLTAK